MTVSRYPEDGGYNAGQTWVKVEELVFVSGGVNYNKLAFASEQAHECRNDLEAIREAFKAVRSRMKTCVHYWRDNVEWARREKGGKRGYYTKHANYWHGRIMVAAADWKLCKQLWKEITKL